MTDLIDDVLSHHGVKGMHWGQRKLSSLPPKQQLDALQNQRNKMDMNKALAGYNLRGYQIKKMYKREIKKNPDFTFNKLSPEAKQAWLKKGSNRAIRRTATEGAISAAILLGVGNYAVSKVHVSPSASKGARISVALLAGNVGRMTMSQISAIKTADKLDESFAQTKAIEDSIKNK